MTETPDDRSAMALAMQWASQVMTIAMEMALPPLVGHWIDARFGFNGLWTILGAIVGLAMGMWHLMLLAKTPPESKPPVKKQNPTNDHLTKRNDSP